jgi:hypothetical protein
VFARSDISRPLLYIPTGGKPSVAVRCNPILFKLRGVRAFSIIRELPFPSFLPSFLLFLSLFPFSFFLFLIFSYFFIFFSIYSPNYVGYRLNSVENVAESIGLDYAYRMIFAVASSDGVTIHDTQSLKPLCRLVGMSYFLILRCDILLHFYSSFLPIHPINF